MKDRSHDEAMAELFQEDPAFAAEYMAQLLRDGEAGDFEAAQRQMALCPGVKPCSRQALDVGPQRETPGEQAGRFKDHQQLILTKGREPKTKTERDREGLPR